MQKTGYPVRHILFLNVSFSRYFANQAVKTPRRTESVSSAVSDSGKSDYFSEEKKEKKEFLASSSLGRTDVKSASRNNIISAKTNCGSTANKNLRWGD